MSRLYSFTAAGSCLSCGKQLDKPGSLLVHGMEAMVDDNGVVSDGETNLILHDPEVPATCGYCGNEVALEAVEE